MHVTEERHRLKMTSRANELVNAAFGSVVRNLSAVLAVSSNGQRVLKRYNERAADAARLYEYLSRRPINEPGSLVRR